MTRTHTTIAALIAAAAPALAEAHPGHGVGISFASGALHPLSGLDHLMALVAVGLLAGRMGGWARWAIPAAFLSLLGVGIALGFAGLQLRFVEAAILASVIVCAALVVVPPRRLPITTCALIGLFAIFHGNAHGFEVAAGLARSHYAAGLMLSSALVLSLTAWLTSGAARTAHASRH
jgi:urease accessory protein